jgi:transcriptional regulator with GAF, ATPase, and Fis domain
MSNRGAIIAHTAMASTTPLLIVIAGPARGRSVSLDRALTIGRDEASALAIPDPALSRRHCEIELRDGDVVLRDLGSRNGCFVNGRPVTTQPLADGDRIRIGDSALLYFEPGTRPLPETLMDLVPHDDTPVPSESTVTLSPLTSRYRWLTGGEAGPAARSSANLALLLRLSDAVQRVGSVDQLRRVLLEETLSAVPAELAVILTDVEASTTPKAAALVQTGTISAVNAILVGRVFSENVALLANDLSARDEPGKLSDSPPASGRAALCAPLSSIAPGAIYLARSTDQGFTDDDLHLVAAIGSIGGLALDRAAALESLRDENARLRQVGTLDHQLIGETAAMQTVNAFIARVAPTEATVLIRGESGTGKELVARAIHANSARARGPFVVINCAALPEGLLESELFGHERGAFTGAVAQQRGKLELAEQGTIFLDEIGELAPPLQAKLLRVLQDHLVERLGGRRALPIDVRVVAATNRDLEQAIADGMFRRDLFYRLNVVSFVMPPLRERRDDIALLAMYFVRKHAARCKRLVRGLTPAARQLLRAHDWPGNVRELENAIERAVVLGTSGVIEVDDLPEALVERAGGEGADSGFHSAVAAHKRQLIRDALDRSNGNVAEAARSLGLQPTYLHRLIRTLNVRDHTSKTRPTF